MKTLDTRVSDRCFFCGRKRGLEMVGGVPVCIDASKCRAEGASALDVFEATAFLPKARATIRRNGSHLKVSIDIEGTKRVYLVPVGKKLRKKSKKSEPQKRTHTHRWEFDGETMKCYCGKTGEKVVLRNTAGRRRTLQRRPMQRPVVVP